MRSFQQVIALLFALFVFALAQEPSYDATVYITSTVTKVNTVTYSGSHTASLGNSTSTIPPSHVTSAPGNATIPAPTSVLPTTTAQFTGAASHLNANAFIAAVAAGVGYLAL